jgi:DNA-binding response OmpR family regulator
VPRLLLVEDDAAIAEPLSRTLRRHGYDVDWAPDGAAAQQLVAATRPDLVILDLGLPDIDGIDVCRWIRATHHHLPIVMLTARSEELDAVLGLDTGADDYVTKPFRTAELLARIRSRLRVGGAGEVEAQDLRVDPAGRQVWRDGTEIVLTHKEFDLLALLVGDIGRVVDRDRIMREVWDEHWYGTTKTLDMHVSWLRRKLGDDPSAPRYITTVRGVGLRFEVG